MVFTLTGPGGFSYTQSDPLTSVGNGTYTASDTLPTSGTVAASSPSKSEKSSSPLLMRPRWTGWVSGYSWFMPWPA